MKKIKKRLILVSVLVILIAIASIFIYNFLNQEKDVEAASSTAKIETRDNARPWIQNINDKKMLDYDNIYCVSHGVAVNLPNGTGNFTAISKAELRGNKVTFYKYNKDGTTKSGLGKYYSIITAEMAAVLSNAGKTDSKDTVGYGYVDSYTDGNINYNNNTYHASEVQKALWHMWNEWVELTGATDYGFKTGNGNNESYGSASAWQERSQYMQDKEIRYSVDIYFLTYDTADNGGTTATSFQNLILVQRNGKMNTAQMSKIWKVWDDNKNSEGLRPTQVTFQVMKGIEKGNYDESYVYATAILTGESTDSEWKGEIEVPDGGIWLYEVPDGKTEINYDSDVGEEWTWGYFDNSGIKGWKITNKIKTTHLTVTKKYVDSDGNEIDNTAGVTIKLKNDRNEDLNKTINLNWASGWTYTFTDLPRFYSDGTKITYSVEETNVPSKHKVSYVYDESRQNCTVINKYMDYITIKVTKKWDDLDDRDGLRPSYIIVKAICTECNSNETITLNESNGWVGTGSSTQHTKDCLGHLTFTEVMEGSSLKDNYTYSIGYSNTVKNDILDVTVTNTHYVNNILIQKVWEDNNNQKGVRPSSVKFELRDGTKGDYENSKVVSTVILNESNNWKGMFTGISHWTAYWLTETMDDKTEEYYISDVGEDHTWDGKTRSYIVTNRLVKDIKIKVRKEWIDGNNRDNIRPDSIQLKLTCKKCGKEHTIDMTSADKTLPNVWEKTITGHNERCIGHFEITETNTPDGYEVLQTEYGTEIDENDTLTISVNNYHSPERVKVKILKKWDDLNDLDEYRPEKVKFKLKADGNIAQNSIGRYVGEITMTAPTEFADTWEYVVDDLYRYDQGQEIQYTLEEVTHGENKYVDDNNKYKAQQILTSTETDSDGTKIYVFNATNTHEVNYDGYVEISGIVWLDGKAGKSNEIDGIYNENSSDTLLEGIKVVLKDKDGNQFDKTSTAVTDANGKYAIRVNYDNSQKVYKLYENAEEVSKKLETAYIEFEYDANKYTTVKDVSTIKYETPDEKLEALSSENKSKATEDVDSRNTFSPANIKGESFDENHYAVSGTTKKSTEWNETITAKTITIDNYNNSKCLENVFRYETFKWCNGDGTYIRTNPEGAEKDILKGEKDLETHNNHNKEEHTSEGHEMRTCGIRLKRIQNVNLGLFEREQPEIAIYEDLSKVEVKMDGQKYTYLYNVKSNKYADAEIKVKFQNKDTYTYRRPVNPADIAYIQEPANNNLLEAYVTYEVKIGNLSSTLPIKVNEIINAYDSEYESLSISVKHHSYNQKQYEGFNTINIEELQMMIQPGQESETIELTYKISNKAILGLLNEDATLNNAVEIISYTTWYGENTLYAEQQTGGRTGYKYGGRDDSSQPANAGFYINEDGRIAAQNDEFDTDIAPSFVLCKATKEDGILEYKTLSGTVWQDTDANTEDNERIGNGKQDEDEKGSNVKGVKVELFKIKDDGTTEIAQLYGIKKLDTGEYKSVTKDAVTYSDENGNYSFGDSEYGVTVGKTADRYIMKFTYGTGEGVTTTIGDVEISARDYKSTIISEENKSLYDVIKGTSTSTQWHLDMKQEPNYSIAVDDVNLRVIQENNLTYQNFEEKMNMEAYGKPFEMLIEFDTDANINNERYQEQVNENGKTEKYSQDLSVFDFGIIERPREDIFVETTIDYLKISLANGQVLTSGDPKEAELTDVKAIGFDQEITSGEVARKSIEKRAIIEIDSELIQGATLEIRYEIKVTNNGEINYEYSPEKTEYYYFGTNEKDKSEVITNSVNKLVYYMDNDLVWTADETNWENKSAKELYNSGLISEKTQNEISDEYTAFITTQFANIPPKDAGENVKVDYISAKRLLANSDDNKYTNQAEILEIDAKIARTIKGIDANGVPETKTYKMGNYVTSNEGRKIYKDDNQKVVYVPKGLEEAKYHEQDDDRVNVVITPPTGIGKYISYALISMIGLTILAMFVAIIRKRFLKLIKK